MKSKFFTVLIGLFGIFSGNLGAQETAPEWFFDKPIVEILFEGLNTVSVNDLNGVTRSYINKPLTTDLFRELQTKLYELDYFDGLIEGNAEKADALGNTVRIRFTVKEKPSIVEIKFQGNSKLGDMELQGVVKIKSSDLVNQNKLRLDEIALREHYLDKGYMNAKISFTTEPNSRRAEGVNVIFIIDEGVGTTIKTIQFSGLSFASPDTLKGTLESKENGFLEPGFFKEGKLALDVKKIQAYYWDRGYIDAKVVEVKREAFFDEKESRNYLSLTFVIDEGVQYSFGGFEFRGNSLFDTKTLQALVRQTPGKVVSKQKLDADYQRILDLYWENGYIFNRFDKQEIRQDNTISYLIDISEQSRAHIENIIINGNTKTKSQVILRELPIEEGDVFSKSRVLEGYENLLRLNYFQSVIPETPQGSSPGLMDLVINVQEGQTAEILFGLTFSGGTEFPLSGQLKWQDRNFMGGGQTFGVETTVSPYAQNLSVNYTETWLFNQRLSLGGQFNVSHTLRTNVSQDVSPPYSSTGLPDPYVDGEYVYSKDTTDSGGILRKKGESYPYLNPSASDISTYSLVKRYDYDQENSQLRNSGNLMDYHDYAVSFGLNTGYAFHTFLGRFGLGTGIKTTLQYLTYNDAIYRPANASIRDNLNIWQLENQWWSRYYYDTRNLTINTSQGVYLSETITLMGGFLGGKTHLARFDTKAEAYFKLIDFPIVEEYTFKMILKAKSMWQLILSPLGGDDGKIVAQPKDLLYMDGMVNGRGWTSSQSGYSFFSNSLELRMPILEQLLWFDLFADAVAFTGESNRIFTKPLSMDQFVFSVGGGIRVSNPQLPLSFYFSKPFRIDSAGAMSSPKGDGIFGDWDLKFVLSLGTESF